LRLILTEDITEDMELARPIYDKGSVLLNKGVKNLYKYKQKLLSIGVKHLYVKDKFSYDIEVDPVIKESTRRRGEEVVEETFEKIKNGFLDLDVKNMKSLIDDITSEIIINEEVLLNLASLKNTSSYTYEHSVNVSVISITLGKILGYSQDDLFKLGMGGILHDMGKILIPEDILNKAGSLTEFEYQVMKNHSELGFDYLQALETVSPMSRIIVLSHHERVDGSGYPRGKVKDEIHEFARIGAIADVFDALTSDRVYRKRWPTYKAAEYIMNNTEKLFDYELVKKLMPQLSFYPNGTEVILSTGHRGLILSQNVGFPTRPLVRLIEDEEGNEMEKELDLLKHLNIIVDDVVM